MHSYVKILPLLGGLLALGSTLPVSAATNLLDTAISLPSERASPADVATAATAAKRMVGAADMQRFPDEASKRVAVEQLQFALLSLPAAARSQMIEQAMTATNGKALELVEANIRTIQHGVGRDLETAMSAKRALSTTQSTLDNRKLGTVTTDLTFVPTGGPCRVVDTRQANGRGQLASSQERAEYVYSVVDGYNWSNNGGSGTVGSGSCTNMLYTGIRPQAVVATLTVVDGSAGGDLRAWDGAAATINGTSAINWLGGQVLANTTVIPIGNRGNPTYNGISTVTRDVGFYNDSSQPISFIVDVLGYFIENQATALECADSSGTSTAISANGRDVYASAGACATGYTGVGSSFFTASSDLVLADSGFNYCRVSNLGASATSFTCVQRCCRLPGR